MIYNYFSYNILRGYIEMGKYQVSSQCAIC